jgi:hypothetical protein
VEIPKNVEKEERTRLHSLSLLSALVKKEKKRRGTMIEGSTCQGSYMQRFAYGI